MASLPNGTADLPAVPRAMESLLQIHPHEAGHFFAHELGASPVKLLVLLRRFGTSLLVGVRVKSLERRLRVLFPVRVLLLEFRLRDAFGRRNQTYAVPDKDIELAIAVDVSDPDP